MDGQVLPVAIRRGELTGSLWRPAGVEIDAGGILFLPRLPPMRLLIIDSIVISFSIAGKFPILAKYLTSSFSNHIDYHRMKYKTSSDFKLDTAVYPPVDFSDMRSDSQDIIPQKNISLTYG